MFHIKSLAIFAMYIQVNISKKHHKNQSSSTTKKVKGTGFKVGKTCGLKSLRTWALEYNISPNTLHCVFSLGDLQSSSKFTKAWRDSVALQIRACQPHSRCINVRGGKIYISGHFRRQTAFYFHSSSTIPSSPSSSLLLRKIINLQQKHGLVALPGGRQNRPDF